MQTVAVPASAKFSKWMMDDVEQEFGIRKHKTLPALQTWLNANTPISAAHKEMLLELRELLREYANDWNEEELKMKFISFIIRLADLDGETYHTFLERELRAEVQGVHSVIKASGTVDLMLASGVRAPRKPFFSFHEYKKERNSANDPQAQLLVSLLAAQAINDDGLPLYGCYVVGRNWFFLALDGKEYDVSLAYDATQDDIFDILAILRNLKVVLSSRLGL
jgi:hypothetical protein